MGGGLRRRGLTGGARAGSHPLYTAAMIRALVIRTAGTNCDAEMARGFGLAGARADTLHLDRLAEDPARLDDYELLGLPGGFSHGDDIASGRVFALRLRRRLYPALRAAVDRGMCVIAACNGFQVAVQAGLLPGPVPDGIPAGGVGAPPGPPPQELALAHNAGGRFVDRWVSVVPVPESVCVWTRGLAEGFAPEAMMLPIAHGEGRVVASSPAVLARLAASGQIAMRYRAGDNPNGSTDDIAGVCDVTGRVFGLMPHPERYLDWTRHPFWTRLDAGTRRGDTPGLAMFRRAVAAVGAGGLSGVPGVEGAASRA